MDLASKVLPSLWLLTLVLGGPIVPPALGMQTAESGTEYLISKFPNFEAALAAMPLTNATLVIDSATTVSASARVPANIALRFDGPGTLTVSRGQKLTVQGRVLAPAKIIFPGTGTVDFVGNVLLSALLPQRWGAVGNKIVDDSKAIQLALTAAGTLPRGGAVRLASVSYRCAAGLSIGSNVQLIGNGNVSQLFFQSDGGIVDAIQIHNANNVEISDLGITGAVAPTLSRLISINSGKNIRVKHCFLSGANRKPASGQISAISFENSSDVWIEDNDISKNGPVTGLPFGVEVGGYLLASANIHVRRNHIVGSTTLYGIHFVDATESDAIDNYVDQGSKDAGDDHSGYGITFYQLSPGNKTKVTITGNTVLNCAGQGIYVAGFDQVTVEQNRVFNVAQRQRDPILPVGGISLNVTNYVTVTGNVVKKSGMAGLVLANTSHVVAVNNTIEDTQRAGIWLRETEQDASLSDNIIDKSAEAGVRVTKPILGLRLIGNQIKNTATWSIMVATELKNGNISENSITTVGTGGGIFVGGGTNNVLHHNEVRNVRGNGINYDGTSGTVDQNQIIGINPASTIYGIVAAGGKDLLIEANVVSNCLQGISVGPGLGVVRNNTLKGNSTPMILSPGTVSTANVLMP